MLHAMTRVNKLLDHKDYSLYMERINHLEKERIFCKHGFEHGLGVARIAYSYLLEKGEVSLGKEVIYAAALLHDIGRWVEYQTGEDHAEVSARLALPLLKECGFSPEDTQAIVVGIKEHRRHHDDDLSLLGEALAIADDWARDCRYCSAQNQCYKFSPAMKQIVY
ncbi:putative domain HDIG-containing protein [Desulfosporosinus orientis DSM 765]|uniref:Putative domain HDIG-containing protein n=1 Tax=Desulfosporosinus orientis (strain ATCC 19365 / DSM 765 / NCIMB 8382 / VKM B-1628 / Singapore I) TaxID=768706 RepID=G7W4W6_DESOD|nr:HD domain-containing protein [Desulfosporosinus orientis]AET65838.1 putative domain HDIG-containing protein [Desulfosporosinus orientis DSM 765]